MEHTNTPNNVQGTLTIMDQQLIVLIVFIHIGCFTCSEIEDVTQISAR